MYDSPGPIYRRPADDAIEAADLGEAPDSESVEILATALILSRLKDPDSAKIDIGDIRKGAYQVSEHEPFKYAWHLPVACNAKNSYGGYTGSKPWDFFVVNGKIVALGIVDRGVYQVAEIDGGGVPHERAFHSDGREEEAR